MSRQITPAPFRVFVYGTLKRGLYNHDRFCRGVLAIDEAVICGRLYALHAQIPALDIPAASVLAHGSLAYADDRRRQQELTAPIAGGEMRLTTTEEWRSIHGEVLTFPEPERLARLDQLEGFHPPGPCLYQRVLAPVQVAGGAWLAAWVYCLGERARQYALPWADDRWQPPTEPWRCEDMQSAG